MTVRTIEGFKFPTCEVCGVECPNFRDKTGEQVVRFCSNKCRANRDLIKTETPLQPILNRTKCKNNVCQNQRRHGSAFCQDCSDNYKV